MSVDLLNNPEYNTYNSSKKQSCREPRLPHEMRCALSSQLRRLTAVLPRKYSGCRTHNCRSTTLSPRIFTASQIPVLHHPGSPAIVDETAHPSTVTPTATAVPRLQVATVSTIPDLAAGRRLLYVRDNNSPLQFLVDIGAEVSLIPASYKDRQLPASCTLEAANYSPINVYSEHSLTLLFSGAPHSKLTWVFLVADVQQPILAADFLAHHGFTVDLSAEFLVHQSGTRTYASSALVRVPRIYTVLPNQCSYRAVLPLTPDCFRIAKAELEHMRELGIIRLSSSQWASPLHLVCKKDSDWHPFGDYRQPPTYHQIPITEEDILKTAVTTPFSLNEFLRMPFGLRNAAQTFQRFMDDVTRGLQGVFVYIDDILIASSSHAITADGITPAQEKVSSIRQFPKPTTKRQLQKYLGMINFFRRFILRCALLLAPLQRLLAPSRSGRGRDITWTSEATEAFETLSPQQNRYSAFGKELLAVYTAIKYFRTYVEGKDFHILMDQKPLTFALHNRSRRQSPREEKHLDFIAQLTTDIRHIQGTNNQAANALSRVSISMLEQVQLQGSQNTILCDTSLGRPRPYILPSLRWQFFEAYHTHRGIRPTQDLIHSKGVWPGISRDVRQWCRTCIECQHSIPCTRRLLRACTPRRSRPSTSRPGLQLTMIYRFTRCPVATPIQDTAAATIAKIFISTWISRYGTSATDLRCTAAEMFYRTTIALPADFLVSSRDQYPGAFGKQLRDRMARIHSCPTRPSRQQDIYLPHDLQDCSHVFIRRPTKPPLCLPYEGPFPVIKRDKNGTPQVGFPV
ncbi:uncharacterized protein LOC119570859 [Penaeus monodon]|uniref:uncharacterized protein LOC119570859 n=1 Tax=Penaeus monodon TaxID=6687 RepID=UPI0018A6EBC9|nr:uncharacterized protein LOC119570859 [Penaeus monodon]